MKRVLENYEGDHEVPFAMRFMEMPDQNDRLSCTATSTITAKYTTTSGPTNAPDDGQVTSRDSD